MMQKIIAIVPAAGIGERAIIAPGEGSAPRQSKHVPKQYRLLHGQPMLRHAVQALLADSRIHEIRVAVARDDVWAAEALQGLPRTVLRYCGGAARADTVIAALEDADLDATDWVMVHDAARPGLSVDALRRLIDTCLKQDCGGILAVPVADTIKRERGHVSSPVAQVGATVAREGLWLAQTPQLFRAQLLLVALRAARSQGVVVSDEASAIELINEPVLLVKGSSRNFKVTWPDDFSLMEQHLAFLNRGRQ